jgi:putative addiction module component (TIGR02574 family)
VFPLLPLEDLDYSDIMSIDQIAAEALRLPPRERALLAESLWESLSDPRESSAGMDDRAALTLAQARDRQIEAGEVTPVLHDEMMAKLRR